MDEELIHVLFTFGYLRKPPHALIGQMALTDLTNSYFIDLQLHNYGYATFGSLRLNPKSLIIRFIRQFPEVPLSLIIDLMVKAINLHKSLISSNLLCVITAPIN